MTPEVQKLIERLKSHERINREWGRVVEGQPEAMLEAADALSAQSALLERAGKALELIRLTDWGWRGGGSEVRNPGEHGRIASRVLGLPENLPLGWPSVAEHDQIKAARASISQEIAGEQ